VKSEQSSIKCFSTSIEYRQAALSVYRSDRKQWPSAVM